MDANDLLRDLHLGVSREHEKLRRKLSVKEYRESVNKAYKERGISNEQNNNAKRASDRLKFDFDTLIKLKSFESQAGKPIDTALREQDFLSRIQNSNSEPWLTEKHIPVHYRLNDREIPYLMDYVSRNSLDHKRQKDLIENRVYTAGEKRFTNMINRRFRTTPPVLSPVACAATLHLLKTYQAHFATVKITIDDWITQQLSDEQITDDMKDDLRMLRRLHSESEHMLHLLCDDFDNTDFNSRKNLLFEIARYPLEDEAWQNDGSNRRYSATEHPDINPNKFTNHLKKSYGNDLTRSLATKNNTYRSILKKEKSQRLVRKPNNYQNNSYRNQNYSRGRGRRRWYDNSRNFDRKRSRSPTRNRNQRKNYRRNFNTKNYKKLNGLICYNAAKHKGKCLRPKPCHFCTLDRQDRNRFEETTTSNYSKPNLNTTPLSTSDKGGKRT